MQNFLSAFDNFNLDSTSSTSPTILSQTEVKEIDYQLIKSAYKGDLFAIICLLNIGANIETKARNGWTPLYFAIYGRQPHAVKFLLERKANIEARSDNDWTPLHWAAGNGYSEMVSILLDYGANIEAKADSKSTPLLQAYTAGHFSTVKLLLSRGAYYPKDFFEPNIFDFIKQKNLDDVTSSMGSTELWIIWQKIVDKQFKREALREELEKVPSTLAEAKLNINMMQKQISELTEQVKQLTLQIQQMQQNKAHSYLNLNTLGNQASAQLTSHFPSIYSLKMPSEVSAENKINSNDNNVLQRNVYKSDLDNNNNQAARFLPGIANTVSNNSFASSSESPAAMSAKLGIFSYQLDNSLNLGRINSNNQKSEQGFVYKPN